MPSATQGTFRLFRFLGIDVYLHWSWFLLALYEVRGTGMYSSISWNVLEYLCLFAIITMHEFGHALACRQVGGKANQIVLWPFGGIAFVDPPQRPGATLWSIAAGPLVNVVLAPLLWAAYSVALSNGWSSSLPDQWNLLFRVYWIDVGLLAFNMLPVYPLDGGQILRSLLWFVLGRARSLTVATVVGLFGLVGLLGLALWQKSVWLGLITVYLLFNCWGGLMHARTLSRMASLPRRDGFACPNCKAAPPIGDAWRCSNCKQNFDTFQTNGVCPHCAAQYNVTRCLECGEARPIAQWMSSAFTPSGL